MSVFKTIRDGFDGLGVWFEKNNGKICTSSFAKYFEPVWDSDIEILNGKILKKDESFVICDGEKETEIKKDDEKSMYYVHIEKIKGLDDAENNDGVHCIPDILFSNMINKEWHTELTKIINLTRSDDSGFLGGMFSSRVSYTSVEVSDKQFKITVRPINKYWNHRTVIYKLVFTFDIAE